MNVVLPHVYLAKVLLSFGLLSKYFPLFSVVVFVECLFIHFLYTRKRYDEPFCVSFVNNFKSVKSIEFSSEGGKHTAKKSFYNFFCTKWKKSLLGWCTVCVYEVYNNFSWLPNVRQKQYFSNNSTVKNWLQHVSSQTILIVFLQFNVLLL